jgi:hypothetical protein
LHLHSHQTVEEYQAVRQALMDLTDGQAPSGDWRSILRRHKVRYLLLSDQNRPRRLSVFTTLLKARDEWALLAVEGGVALFGWKDNEPGRFADAQTALERAALFPAASKSAPEDGPPRDPREQSWLEAFSRQAPSEAPDREEALYYLNAFETQRTALEAERLATWDFSLAGAATATPGRVGLPPVAVSLALQLHLLVTSRAADPDVPVASELVIPFRLWRNVFFATGRRATPATLLACIRAARRAVHADPDDALAYQALGEAYLALREHTPERSLGQPFAELRDLRRAQVSTAFHQVLKRQPDQTRAHSRLARYYKGQGAIDLSLRHLRAYRKQLRWPDERGAQAVEEIEKGIQDRRSQFNREAARLRVLDRARLARRLGLTGQALTLLLESDVAAFGWEGALLQLDLLLMTGDPRQVLEDVDEEKEQTLGGRHYHWLLARADLALGDYQKANIHLAAQDLPQDSAFLAELRHAAAKHASAVVLLGNPLEGGPGRLAGGLPLRVSYYLRGARKVQEVLLGEADRLVIRGLIALEAGNGDEAQLWFRRALKIYGSPAKAASGGGLDFPARPLAEFWLQTLESVGPPPH